MVMLLGMVRLAPFVVLPLVRLMARPLQRVMPAEGRLAADAAQANPGRTAATAATLLVALSVVVVNATVAASFVGTVKSELDARLLARLTVQPIGYARVRRRPAGRADDARCASRSRRCRRPRRSRAGASTYLPKLPGGDTPGTSSSATTRRSTGRSTRSTTRARRVASVLERARGRRHRPGQGLRGRAGPTGRRPRAARRALGQRDGARRGHRRHARRRRADGADVARRRWPRSTASAPTRSSWSRPLRRGSAPRSPAACRRCSRASTPGSRRCPTRRSRRARPTRSTSSSASSTRSWDRGARRHPRHHQHAHDVGAWSARARSACCARSAPRAGGCGARWPTRACWSRSPAPCPGSPPGCVIGGRLGARHALVDVPRHDDAPARGDARLARRARRA